MFESTLPAAAEDPVFAASPGARPGSGGVDRVL
jgi:hypothetical protein